MSQALLPVVERALEHLTQASLFLAQAAKYADSDRFSFNPLSVFAGPLKYWKWSKAKKSVTAAAAELETLRGQRSDVPDAAQIDLSNLDAINDLFDVLPFRTRLTGTKGGPSRLKQQIGFETTILHEIETTRVTVDHVLSEVGLLHKRIREGVPARATP
jgi:hypothetical protein